MAMNCKHRFGVSVSSGRCLACGEMAIPQEPAPDTARVALRRAAGKLRDIQRACAGLQTVLEEVEDALDGKSAP